MLLAQRAFLDTDPQCVQTLTKIDATDGIEKGKLRNICANPECIAHRPEPRCE
jgi:hypothetical protein